MFPNTTTIYMLSTQHSSSLSLSLSLSLSACVCACTCVCVYTQHSSSHLAWPPDKKKTTKKKYPKKKQLSQHSKLAAMFSFFFVFLLKTIMNKIKTFLFFVRCYSLSLYIHAYIDRVREVQLPVSASLLHTCTYATVSIRQHTPAYVSIRQQCMPTACLLHTYTYATTCHYTYINKE